MLCFISGSVENLDSSERTCAPGDVNVSIHTSQLEAVFPLARNGVE